ncbi:MAG TPA: DUF4376 domain-containing protein [Thiomonas arsenitoxydans]|uniref:DUF4376 domain-containing protein n=1 Tax=Thiomonas arsenitoxydans (strain DSM 22701 / CIP 110005 / 3As) TaxID=426114 RepID=UPI002CE67373|nr:DUF4376 domain-containing protein [Thiomonas arsenitoxydans]HML83166.1 DUF4376 domain-containing protein [Thiomonas arsenitoxydans]
MTQMYYRLPDGEPTSNLPALIPHVINPQALTDTELADYNVSRCTVVHPPIEWWQQRGARQIDAEQTPHVITWAVETRPLEDVRALAWQRIKDERDEKQRGLMPYTYPSGDTHHNEMAEKVLRDLNGQATGALILSSVGVTDPVMPWTTFENATHYLTPAQMLSFAMAALQWHSAIHIQSQTIRAAITAAETVQAVIDAAVWPEA